MVYMYHSFLIHSSVDGHLGCFHVLVIINSAAMNTGVHASLSDLVSLVCMPRSGIAESYGWVYFQFFKKSGCKISLLNICIFKVLYIQVSVYSTIFIILPYLLCPFPHPFMSLIFLTTGWTILIFLFYILFCIGV